MSEAAAQWPIENREYRDPRSLIHNPQNARKHSPEQIRDLAKLMIAVGVTAPILVDEDGMIIYGHARCDAAVLNIDGGDARFERYPIIVARGWSDDQKRAYMLADNQMTLRADWDLEGLKLELAELSLSGIDLELTGFDSDAIDAILNPVDPLAGAGSLAARFGVPPFTVLRAAEGWWQDRKRAWLSLGIQSEIGRGENLVGRSPQELFCHFTGIRYDKARAIVTRAIKAQGDAFDLQALIAKHAPASRRRGSADSMPSKDDAKRKRGQRGKQQ